MALVSDITTAPVTGRIGGMITEMRARLERRRQFKRTLREMSSLSSRELADLGLNRSEIKRVAYQAAYEN
ncbi:MAG: DUF1127 domain-containing protein [Pelagimonas sp.]|jgi:uncharacterized protein YjiS (DUF1127 family)|nr:DUF1127 domain-containing protein [Pelagimonas sp.]